MIVLLQILAIGIVLYAMKVLPFAWRVVPRTPLAEQIIDLLPVALLMAMLLPQVLTPLIVAPPTVGGVVALAAVIAAFAICCVGNRTTLAIGAGLAILALAELV